MVEQGNGGVIVNISSIHEDLPMVGNAAYCTAIGGLHVMTRTLATELAKHEIRIVNVGPGAIIMPINTETLHNPATKSAPLAEIPLERLGVPEDVANCVAWAASDQANYITGATIFVDGGIMDFAGSL
jgi:glucose 1-dehydrogenase